MKKIRKHVAVAVAILSAACSNNEVTSAIPVVDALPGPLMDRSHVGLGGGRVFVDLDPTYSGLLDSAYTGQEFTVRCLASATPPAHHPFILKFSDSSVVQNMGIVGGSGAERIFKIKSIQSTDSWKSSILYCGFGDDEGDPPYYGGWGHQVTSTTPPRPVSVSYTVAQANPVVGSTTSLGISSVTGQRSVNIGSYTVSGNTGSGGTHASINAGGTITGLSLGVDTVTYSICAQPFHTNLPSESPCTTFSRVVNVRPLAPTITSSLRLDTGHYFAHMTWASQTGVTNYRVWRKCVDNLAFPNGNPWESEVVAGTSYTTYDEASSFSDTTPGSPYFMYYIEALSPSGLASNQSAIKYFVGSASPMGC